MSGHSKWHNIQGKKGKMDQLKANAFTKVGRLITVAAQQGGGDPDTNFSLRLAIRKRKPRRISSGIMPAALRVLIAGIKSRLV